MTASITVKSGPEWLLAIEDQTSHYVAATGFLVEIVGVTIIIVAAVVSTAIFLRRLFRGESSGETYQSYRASLGRGILLGLEYLVAGDIIRTVAVKPDLENLAVLAGIVLIRTFLSFTLEVEITGRWPWQQASSEQSLS